MDRAGTNTLAWNVPATGRDGAKVGVTTGVAARDNRVTTNEEAMTNEEAGYDTAISAM